MCLVSVHIVNLVTHFLSLANSLEQSPCSEADRSSATQEIPHILWNPKVHYCIYKLRPRAPLLSQINAVHACHSASCRHIVILFSHISPRSSKWSLSLINPTPLPTETLYASLLFFISATLLAHILRCGTFKDRSTYSCKPWPVCSMILNSEWYRLL